MLPPKKQRIAHKPAMHDAVALSSRHVMTPKASISPQTPKASISPQTPVVMPVAQSVAAAASRAPVVTSIGERSILLQQD